MKNHNIVPLAYGEDFLDPRKVEKVNFLTIMISDEEFKNKYYHDAYPEFYESMLSDRNKYRKIFMTIEAMNVTELMTDERRMPVDVNRIVNDILRTETHKTADAAALKKMVAIVNALCE